MAVFAVAFCFLPLARGAATSEYALTIDVSSSLGCSVFCVTLADCDWNSETETYTWQAAAPFELYDGATGGLIATVVEADLELCLASPQRIAIRFEADSGGATTEYAVASGMIDMGGGSVSGHFSTQAGVEDSGSNGAILVGRGEFSGIGIGQAQYTALSGGDTLFSHLVGVLRVGSGAAASVSQQDPADGSMRLIADDAIGVSAQACFALTSYDRGSVNLTLEVEEESADCPADFDRSGLVDLRDLMVVLLLYGTHEGEPGFDPVVDLDVNGEIGLSDLVYLLSSYGQACP